MEDRPAAAIATATLEDFGLLDDHRNVIDPNKIRRWKSKLMKNAQDIGEESTKQRMLYASSLMVEGMLQML